MSIVACSCGKTIEVKPEWAGAFIRCRGCGARIYVPHPGEAAAEPATAVETRPCPYCAEPIRREAVKCRWCGNSARPGGAAAPPPPRAPVEVDNGGTWILVIAIIGWVIWCLGLVLHPLAWAMGASHESNCRARGIEPGGAVRAGKILGIIGTLIYGAGVLFFILVALAGALA
jgi:hypothetical protein